MQKIIVIILISTFASVHAQNTFQFKGQLLHNKTGPLKQTTVLINGNSTVTNDDGVFVIGLPNQTTNIRVTLPQSTYGVLYPYGGYVAIPRNLNDVPQVIVGSPKENDYLNQYLKLYQLLKKKENVSPEEIRLLSKKLDSLESLLVKLHYSQTDLIAAREKQNGKDDYYPEISADLLEFKSKAVDLKNAFKYISDFAFDNPNALQRLVEAITNYNNIRNKLDRQSLNYEKRIGDFWQDDSLKKEFNGLAKLALNKIHTEKVLPMQETVAQINKYFQGNRDNNLKKSVQQKIGTSVNELEILLPELEANTTNFLSKLSD